jgi:type II secretory pathway pseudopilin PulG
MAKNQGYTLVELIIFIVILAIVSSTILIGAVFAIKRSPITHRQTIATAAASGCLDYLLGQRELKGFNFNGQSCPGGGTTTIVPTFCSNIHPSGFTVAVNISCANVAGTSGSQEYKLIRVSNLDSKTQAGIELNLLIANY